MTYGRAYDEVSKGLFTTTRAQFNTAQNKVWGGVNSATNGATHAAEGIADLGHTIGQGASAAAEGMRSTASRLGSASQTAKSPEGKLIATGAGIAGLTAGAIGLGRRKRNVQTVTINNPETGQGPN